MALPKSDEARASYAIWTTSFMDWGLMLIGPVLGVGLHAALPVGLNVRLSDTTDWVFEVTPMLTRKQCTNVHGRAARRCGTVRALKGAVGVAWTPWPGARGDGLFLHPKVSGMWTHDVASGPELTGGLEGGERRETGGQVVLGLDVGYRKTAARSRAFIAPVLGVGVGYSWNQRRNRFDVGSQFGDPQGAEWKNQRIVDLNIDLVRFGATF
ncbi:hypothetical protein ACLESO_29850 [Pyxidicoccus sp. 3LG]